MEKHTLQQAHFIKHAPDIGEFSLCPLAIPEDIPIIHDWVNREYAKYWNLQNTTREAVEKAYRKITAPEHSRAYLGYYNSKPAFLLECYRAMDDLVGRYYDVQESDYGMHILIGPAERPIHNFTWQIFTMIIDFLFNDPKVQRIVVEPDIRNEKIHVLNRRAGFEYQKQIQFPEKTAYLAFCTRAQYQAALQKENP